MAVWSALAMLPDLDVIGFALGVHYGDPWGHRGAAHSLLIAAALGVALSAIARRRNLPLGRTALFTVAVLASHGLLDTMTDGGLGCALLWPFSLTRYFAPWRPIPVAPIGLDFLSPYGAIVSAIELALFGPLFCVRAAAAPPDDAAAHGRVVDGDVAGVGLADRVGRSDSRLDPRIRASGEHVVRRRLLGRRVPIRHAGNVRAGSAAPARRTVPEDWYYPPRDQPALRAEDAFAGAAWRECVGLRFEYGFAVSTIDEDSCGNLGLWIGTSLDDARRVLGPPREACWGYTWSPTGAFHRLRLVCFLDSRVEVVLRRWVRGG